MSKKKATRKPLLERLETRSQATFRAWPRFKFLWPEVKQALEQGYTMLSIYDALHASDDWESGYDSFRRCVRRARTDGL